MDELSRLAIFDRDFFPQANNAYVPACTYVSEGSVAKISFGTPAVADNDALLAAAAMDLDKAATETFTTFTGVLTTGIMDARYGRNVTVTASGDPGAAVPCTVKGFDYLMQPMTETITIANGSTVGSGLKAFKKVTSISHTGAAANAVTGKAGFGDVLGLPYKTVKVLSEELDGAVASLGSLVTPVLTDPQSATTGDPRGTYDPNSTLDSTKEVTATCVFSNEVVSGNGGYYGIKHFTS